MNQPLRPQSHRARTADEKFAFLAALCRDPELTPADKVVGFVLMHHFSDTAGLTMMSRSAIMRSTGLTEKTVRDVSQRLERHGWFKVEHDLPRTHVHIPLWSRLDESSAT
jgi:hypothetical protein